MAVSSPKGVCGGPTASSSAAQHLYVVHDIALRLRPLQREAVEKARRKINGGANPPIGAPLWRRRPKSPSKSRSAVGRKPNHLRIQPSFYTVWRVVGRPRSEIGRTGGNTSFFRKSYPGGGV